MQERIRALEIEISEFRNEMQWLKRFMFYIAGILTIDVGIGIFRL